MLNHDRADLWRFVVWLGIVLLTAWLVFIGGAAAGILDARLRMTSLVLVGIVTVAWAVVAMRDPAWRPRSVMMPAIAATLVAMVVSTALAPHPRLGIEYVGYAYLLAVLYLLAVRLLADPWFRPRLLALTTSLAVIVGIAYVAIVVGRWIEWWDLVGRVTTPPLRPGFAGMTWANPNAVLAMSVLLTVPAVAWIGWGDRRRALASTILVLLALGVAVLTGSRGGWLAVAVAVVIVGALALAQPDIRAAASGALRNTRTRLAVLVAGVAALAVAVVLIPAIVFRQGTGGAEREGYIAAALRMFTDSPVHGVGPGAWVVGRISHTEVDELDLYIPHAHNIYAQTLAEFGFVGILAGAVIAWSLGRLVLGAIRDPDATRRRVAWCTAVGITYFAVHQFFDMYVNLPAALFAFAVPIAWLDATAPRPENAVTKPLVATGAVLGLAVIGGLFILERPAATMANAVELANRGEWQRADELARDAVTLDPEMPAYQLIVGVTAARVGDAERAAAAFRRAAEVDDLPSSWLGLAAAEARRGEADAARAHVDAALRLGVQQPAIAMAAGDLLLRLGDEDAAVTAFAAAISANTSLAGDPWWRSEPRVAHLRPSILAAAGADARFDVALVADDPVRARQLVEGLGEAQRSRYLDIVAAWGGDAAATDRLRAAMQAQPFDLNLLAWLARIEARAGHGEEATRYRAWSDALNGLSSLAAAELRVDPPPTTPIDIAGTQTNFFGLYTYRRPTPWDVIPPDLVHLTLE